MDRNDAYAEQQGGTTGLNGAVTFTWYAAMDRLRLCITSIINWGMTATATV